ncbi:MAG: flavodoxin [Spirochaetaceae bacterium]
MVTIVYGSSTMNTEFVSRRLQQEFGEREAKLLNVTEAESGDLENAENLILATSSWGSGSLQDDWELFFPKLDEVDLSGKRVALLGLGDQENYPDSFCDALKHLADKVRRRGAVIVGETSTEGYAFSRSLAQEEEGTFVGLIIDEDNQADKTDERLHTWAIRLRKLFRN